MPALGVLNSNRSRPSERFIFLFIKKEKQRKKPTLMFVYVMVCRAQVTYLKLKFILKNSCSSRWSFTDCHVGRLEWARPLIYLFYFLLVRVLHPVFQLCLSLTPIRAHCILVMCSCVVNGLKDAQILMLVSKVHLYLQYVQPELQEQQFYKTLLSRCS